MADLSEFTNAEVGVVRNGTPTATFTFRPGATVGEATFVAMAGEEPATALDRWAADLLGLEPGVMVLLEVLEVRAWGHNPETGAPYRYVKAAVRRRGADEQAAQEAAERWLARHPGGATNGKGRSVGKRAGKARGVGKGTVACAEWRPIADTQLGKGGDERFGGLSETQARLDWTVEAYTGWHDERRKLGYAPDTIVIPLAGDLTEGVCGSYDNQEFITTLNAADQLELAVAAVDRHVSAAVEAAPRVVLTGVASNHDRQSKMGKRENITDAWDDRTFVLLRTLARVYQYRPGYSSVEVVMPASPHVSVVDDGHLVVATIHGHKPKFTKSAAETMWAWWSSELANRRDAAAAQVLLAGHYHHAYTLGPQSGRLLIGLPSLDGGSGWWEAIGQDWSLPGIRPFLTTRQGVRELSTLVWDVDAQQAREQVGGYVA
jgi:hypothetical protein